MIPPRTEFVLSSALLAFALVAAYVLMSNGGDVAPWRGVSRNSLMLALVSCVAAWLGAWVTTGWHRRASRVQRRWSAGGMTLRALLLAFGSFPLVMILCAVVMLPFESAIAPSGSGMAWIVPAALLLTGFAIMLGAVPAFVLEYFVCRRYLRRTAGATTGSA